jgi:hypothetical protein
MNKITGRNLQKKTLMDGRSYLRVKGSLKKQLQRQLRAKLKRQLKQEK